MYSDVGQIIFSEEEIKAKVEQLGEKITSDYRGQEFLAVGILKSSLYFLTDLIREIKIPLITDFIEISDYGTSESPSGPVRIIKDLEENIKNKHVLLIEDLVDTGLTVDFIISHLKTKEPASLKLCVLIDRTKTRIININPDYIGFQTEEKSLVGYGADYKGLYRHLPFVCKLKNM